MVYVGVAPKVTGRGWQEACRAYIDPSLKVARSGRLVVHRMPYWPGYSDIGPEHRAIYLDWLADGRRDVSVDAGYMFLYFYGLERRFLTEDTSPDERQAIADEVERLRNLFAASHSAQRYLGTFLDLARVKDAAIPDDPLSIDRSGWEMPLALLIGLGSRIGRGELLSADWLLAWFLSHPEKRLRTPATRCQAQFEATFRAFFAERFPEGLKVTKPRKHLSTHYEAASGEFTVTVTPEVSGVRVLDVSGLRKPIEIAQEIADEAMVALDGYSRLCGKEPQAGATIQGHLMLPGAIRDAFPCRARDDLLNWAGGIVAANGLAPMLDVVERVIGERTDKPTKRHLTGAADLLARLGIGMAPDPRFALRRPKPDEPVVLFELGREIDALENVSDNYAEALLRIALGAFVAHADGTIAKAEREALIAEVKAAELGSEVERRRLMANLRWFLSVPPDMTLLRKRLKEAGAAEAGTLRAALVAATHADGEVTPEEVSSLEKAYKALGLDAGLVYSDLHDGPVDAPVAVRPARMGAPGEAIPPEVEPVPSHGALDLDRIAAIRSDTARVSSVLGTIFEEDAGDEEAVEAPEDDKPAADPMPVDGLDAAHGHVVLVLISQDHWTEEAFDALARAEGLMPAGALETINEWAFATYDEALLDAYDGYDVEPEIAAALRGPSPASSSAPVPETA